MRPRLNVLPVSFLAVSVTTLAALGCGNGSGASADCSAVTGYTATVTTPPSFATDIYPILANTSMSGGCSFTTICHGTTPMKIDSAGTQTLQFLFSPENPAMAKANLMMASINAPTMQRVVASDPGNSFLAYKLQDKSVLGCINSKCVGTTMSNHITVCGDPMPNVGTISDADRTKILDWIKLGALD